MLAWTLDQFLHDVAYPAVKGNYISIKHLPKVLQVAGHVVSRDRVRITIIVIRRDWYHGNFFGSKIIKK